MPLLVWPMVEKRIFPHAKKGIKLGCFPTMQDCVDIME